MTVAHAPFVDTSLFRDVTSCDCSHRRQSRYCRTAVVLEIEAMYTVQLAVGSWRLCECRVASGRAGSGPESRVQGRRRRDSHGLLTVPGRRTINLATAYLVLGADRPVGQSRANHLRGRQTVPRAPVHLHF